jgi:CheY-like chemotaxis protein
MKILVAEEHGENAFVAACKHRLEDRGHEVTMTGTGEVCLKTYHDKLHIISLYFDAVDHIQPFDVVILDYDIPQINGLEVAKEILAVNLHQRIILVFEHSMGPISESDRQSVDELNRHIGVLNKPISEQVLVDTIEDKSIYAELDNMDVDIDLIKKAKLRHEQLNEALNLLRKVQKQN